MNSLRWGCSCAVDWDRVEWWNMVANDCGPPVWRDSAGCLDKMLAEQIGMVLLGAAITGEASQIGGVSTVDRNGLKSCPRSLEGLGKVCELAWTTGPCVLNYIPKCAAVGRKRLRDNRVNSKVNWWAVVHVQNETLQVAPQ